MFITQLGHQLYRLEFFMVFLSFQENSGTVKHIRPLPIPSVSLPINYSLIILSFNAVESELLTDLQHP